MPRLAYIRYFQQGAILVSRIDLAMSSISVLLYFHVSLTIGYLASPDNSTCLKCNWLFQLPPTTRQNKTEPSSTTTLVQPAIISLLDDWIVFLICLPTHLLAPLQPILYLKARRMLEDLSRVISLLSKSSNGFSIHSE